MLWFYSVDADFDEKKRRSMEVSSERAERLGPGGGGKRRATASPGIPRRTRVQSSFISTASTKGMMDSRFAEISSTVGAAPDFIVQAFGQSRVVAAGSGAIRSGRVSPR